MAQNDKGNNIAGFNQADAQNQSIQKVLNKASGKSLANLPLVMVNWGEIDAQDFQLSGFNRVQFNAFCQAAGITFEPSSLLDFHKFLTMAQDVAMVHNQALSQRRSQVDSDVSLNAEALAHLNAFLQGQSDSLQSLFEGALFDQHTDWVAQRFESAQAEQSLGKSPGAAQVIAFPAPKA